MNRKKAEQTLRAIALKEGVSVQEVRSKIQEAIDIGMSDPDPSVKGFWESIPRRSDRPSPEEVICFLSERASKPPCADNFNLWS